MNPRCMAYEHMDWWDVQFEGARDFVCGLTGGHDGDHGRDEEWERAHQDEVKASVERWAWNGGYGHLEMD